MDSNHTPQCATCPFPISERYCRKPKGKGPASCPSLNKRHLRDAAQEEYRTKFAEFARQATIQESVGYDRSSGSYETLKPVKPRIVEVVEFAHRMNYKKLALIFCNGLRQEARIVNEIMEINGFEMVSMICKVGRLPKEELGIEAQDQLEACAPESACNPIMQALIANEQEVDFNILLGLCVGHDSMAIKYLEAPTTILAVKDRQLGHNPLVAVNMYDSYYRYLKQPLP